MRLSPLIAVALILICTSGCCCFKPGTFGTAYAPPAYSTPPVYQAPAVVQQQPQVVPQQIIQPATYVQSQAVCPPVVCQPVCNPCCP